MRRKIQMKAAMLMTSGTVTKKPVMKLRRSHCIGELHPARGDRREQREPQRDPVPRKGHESSASDDGEKRLDDEHRGDEREDETDRDLERPLRREMVPHLQQ